MGPYPVRKSLSDESGTADEQDCNRTAGKRMDPLLLHTFGRFLSAHILSAKPAGIGSGSGRGERFSELQVQSSFRGDFGFKS